AGAGPPAPAVTEREDRLRDRTHSVRLREGGEGHRGGVLDHARRAAVRRGPRRMAPSADRAGDRPGPSRPPAPRGASGREADVTWAVFRPFPGGTGRGGGDDALEPGRSLGRFDRIEAGLPVMCTISHSHW